MKQASDYLPENGLLTDSMKLPEPKMTRKWIAALFKKFQATYLNQWTSGIVGIEEIVVNEWLKVLHDITPDQVSVGLQTWNEDWPPNAHQFRKACLGKYDEAGKDPQYCKTNAGMYREKPRADRCLPARNKTPTTVKMAESHIAKMREALKTGEDE